MAKTTPGGNPGLTSQLPKATVKLAQTTPMARGAASGPVTQTQGRQTAALEEAEDERDPEAGLVPLSVFALILSLVVLAFNLPNNDSLTKSLQLSSDPQSPTALFFPPVQEDKKWEQGEPFSKTLDATNRDAR